MGRDPRGAAARTGAYDDDATVVDFAAPERARTESASVHDSATVTRTVSFDDLPTQVWTPSRVTPAAGLRPAPRVSIRRLRSVPEPAPSVRLAPPPPSRSDRDEVTRIEVPPPLPARPTEEKTAPGVARRNAERSSIVRRRIATGLIVALLVAGSGFAWLRTHPSRSPAAAAAPVIAATSAPSRPPATPPLAAAPAAPSLRAAPRPAIEPAPTGPTSGSAAPGSGDELAAVEAVQAGDLRRAARLYAALAAAHPGSEAYREAARILLDGTKEARP